ncbi:MAG TPA: HD domain-containing phosphohydrolase [Candidatus Limnocylindrales bacterium]|nr:HD domain-containing phosphohydrolase [Candidatus Limnocylindrales bacterium]
MNKAELLLTPVGTSIIGETSDNSAAIKVLAVEDNPQALKLLTVMLNTPAFRCCTASSGEEALVVLQREQFDAVVSDLRMPGMGGMELIAEARRLHPHVAFLVTTGVDDVEVGVQAMRVGADDYLVKPLLESAVLASLGRALHRKQLEQEVENYRQHLEEMVVERTGQLQRALQLIERSYEDTLQALAAAIDLRDHETAGHSQRVCRYSLEIAGAVGLPDPQLKDLARGAFLHDIGKLGIPDGILLKPGPLTVEERKVMQQHVQIGYELIKDIPFLADSAEIVLYHHEHFDGNGYPHGLKGEHIPESARIFALADALDAITSDRPYRSASSFESAQEAIRREAGRQFDPQLASVFLSIPVERWSNIARKERLASALPFWLRSGMRI